MTFEQIRSVLAWSSLINLGLLLYWFLILILARDWVYRMHAKLFKITEEQFYETHYKGMVYFKIAIFAFMIVPYLVMRIAGP